MNRKIRKYYKFHYREQLLFRCKLHNLDRETDLNKRVDFAEKMILHAYGIGLGILSCPEIEKVFLDLAETIHVQNDTTYKPNTFLHVMTQAYCVGGHTRVVERWVTTSPENQEHSIVLLNQGDTSYPESLIDITRSHGGGLYIFNENKLIDRARKLRILALQYEYVILHVHMYDPTAIVAFGTKKFLRPIIFFNHADHSYWCGYSIIDMLADLRDNNIALTRRGILNVFPIRIPFESSFLQNFPRTKEKSREILGLPLDKTVILTVGGAHKYEPFAGCEFCDVLSKVLLKYEDVVCYGIGPLSSTGNWSKYGNKFVAMGIVNYGEYYFEYLNACDIYINSMPISGGTAMLDAVQFHKPILSYSLFDTKLGDIVKGINETNDIVLFLSQLERLILSPAYANQLAIKQYNDVFLNHGLDTWRKNIDRMLEFTPKSHSIHLSTKVRYKIDDLAIMNSLWNQTLSFKRWTLSDIIYIVKTWCYFIKKNFNKYIHKFNTK